MGKIEKMGKNIEKTGKIRNAAIVKNLKEKAAKAKSIVFADYRGLSAQAANDLRAKLKAENSELVVAQKHPSQSRLGRREG
ncbi:MAG: hypothetical protein KatS3mg087_1503 [Patescibacteria group bacterium]|nr:MAG: hypothetical protein KatS3mg087_1503 [Patescibacteria group bacterium]